MALSISVRFSGMMPSPTDWQASIAQANFPLSLDLEFDPRSFTGFLPAEYAGQPVGFEYYYEELSTEEIEVSLVTHSSARETVSAVLAAACLCRLRSGNLVDDSGVTVSAEECLDWARAQEAELIPLIEEQDQASRSESVTAPKPWWKVW